MFTTQCGALIPNADMALPLPLTTDTTLTLTHNPTLKLTLSELSANPNLHSNHLISYVDEVPDVRGGMHFVLQSNLWATAFPQFYAYDGLARFRIR